MLCLLAAAWGRAAAGAWELAAGSVRVVFDDPALRPYAERVARVAERELSRVAALFGRPLGADAPAGSGAVQDLPVTVRITAASDAFNAFGLPVPRPTVVLRALEPSLAGIGLGSDDALALLLRHELTHVVQLTDPRVPVGGVALPDLGLVGQDSFPLPPAWVLEGVATYVESRPRGAGGDPDLGGRLFDPRTRATLLALAAGGAFPGLADVSLATYEAWPSGQARYLLGVAFVEALVARHGLATLQGALRAFRAGVGTRPFAAAWRAVAGTELADEWSAWRGALEVEAAAAVERTTDPPPVLVTRPGAVAAPAVAPDGRRVAWIDGGTLRVARLDVGPTGGLGEGAITHEVEAPLGAFDVGWLGPDTLVVGGYARDPGTLRAELFTLELAGGAATRRTAIGGVRLPSANGEGCVWFAHDGTASGAAVTVRRWCAQGGGDGVWSVPDGVQVADLAAVPGGAGVGALLLCEGERWVEVLEPAHGGAVRSLARWPMPPTTGAIAWRGRDELVATVVEGDVTALVRFGVARAADETGVVPSATAGSNTAGSDTAALATDPFGTTTAGTTAFGATTVGTTPPDVTPLGTAPLATSAFAPAVAKDGVVFVTLRAEGAALAWWTWDAWQVGRDGPRAAAEPWRSSAPDAAEESGAARGGPNAAPVPGTASATPSVTPSPMRPYRASLDLAPYGWLPVGGRLALAPPGFGVELVFPAQDVTGDHELRWTLGYDTALRGGAGSAYASLRYAFRMATLVPDTRPSPPWGVAVTVGAWPHRPYRAGSDRVAFGVRAEALARWPVGTATIAVRGEVEAVTGIGGGWRVGGGLDAVVGRMLVDAYGVERSGWRLGAHGRASPRVIGTVDAAGPSGDGWAATASLGGWVDAAFVARPSSGPSGASPEAASPLSSLPAPAAWTFGVAAGYRPALPVPLEAELVAQGSIGARWVVPVRLRVADGLLAWERTRIEPALRVWVGASPTDVASTSPDAPWGWRGGLGADVGVGFDGVLDYLAPFALTVRGGVAEGGWLRIEVATSF